MHVVSQPVHRNDRLQMQASNAHCFGQDSILQSLNTSSDCLDVDAFVIPDSALVIAGLLQTL